MSRPNITIQRTRRRTRAADGAAFGGQTRRSLSAMMSETIASLRQELQSVAMELLPGLSTSEIETWERQRGVVLPDEMRSFYLAMNGMPEGLWDVLTWVRIWPLAEVKPLREESPIQPGALDEDKRHLFVFADYLIWSHAYAVALFPESQTSTSVLLVGGPTIEPVSDSFQTFLQALLCGRLPQ